MNFFFSCSTSSFSLFLKNSSKFSKGHSTSGMKYSATDFFSFFCYWTSCHQPITKITCLFFFAFGLTQQLIVSKTAVMVEEKVSLFSSYTENLVKNNCNAVFIRVPEGYETAATLRRKLDLPGDLKSFFSFE